MIKLYYVLPTEINYKQIRVCQVINVHIFRSCHPNDITQNLIL